MKYKIDSELEKQINYRETLKLVQDIWYDYAEGILAFSNHYAEYSTKLQEIRARFPREWEVQLGFEGDISAYRTIPEHRISVKIYKAKNGIENVHVFCYQ